MWGNLTVFHRVKSIGKNIEKKNKYWQNYLLRKLIQLRKVFS